MVTVAPGSTAPLASLTRAGEAAEALLRASAGVAASAMSASRGQHEPAGGRFVKCSVISDAPFAVMNARSVSPRAAFVTRLGSSHPRNAVCHGAIDWRRSRVTKGRSRAAYARFVPASSAAVASVSRARSGAKARSAVTKTVTTRRCTVDERPCSWSAARTGFQDSITTDSTRPESRTVRDRDSSQGGRSASVRGRSSPARRISSPCERSEHAPRAEGRAPARGRSRRSSGLELPDALITGLHRRRAPGRPSAAMAAHSATCIRRSWAQSRHAQRSSARRVAARARRRGGRSATRDRRARGRTPARQVGRRAGLPDRVPATTVNKACASGLEAVAPARGRLRSARPTSSWPAASSR